jgi:hypothetical protein
MCAKQGMTLHDFAERLLRGDDSIPPQGGALRRPSIVLAEPAAFMNGTAVTGNWFAMAGGTICPSLPGGSSPVESQKLFYKRAEYIHKHHKTCLAVDMFDATPRSFKGACCPSTVPDLRCGAQACRSLRLPSLARPSPLAARPSLSL